MDIQICQRIYEPTTLTGLVDLGHELLICHSLAPLLCVYPIFIGLCKVEIQIVEKPYYILNLFSEFIVSFHNFLIDLINRKIFIKKHFR